MLMNISFFASSSFSRFRHSMAKCSFLLLGWLLLLPFPSNAASQRTVRVHGRVMDDKDISLPSVDVIVQGLKTGASTDSSGSFDFTFKTAADTFSLRFSFLGFEDGVRTFRIKKYIPVNSIQTFKANVALQEDVQMLQGINVTETKRQTSTAQSLQLDKIKQVPTASGGVEAIVTSQAGVSTNNELSSQYSVRGGNYDENCVYVNHVEVYRPLLIRSGQQEGLSFINPDMVGSLSFSAGGFSAEYGDKMSSVLDIQYKEPTAFEGSASVSLLGASAYLGSKTGGFSQMHGVRYKSNESLLGSLDTKGEYKPRFFDYQTYLNYNFSPKWKLSFLGNLSRNSYQFEPETRSTSFGTLSDTREFTVYFDGQEKDLFVTYFGNLALQYKPRKNLEMQLTGSSFYTSEHENYDISGEYWLSDAQTDNVNVDFSSGIGSYLQHARNDLKATVSNLSYLGRLFNDVNELKWGLTYQHEHISENSSEWEMRDSAGYSLPAGEDFSLYYNLQSHQSMSSDRFMAYVLDSYRFRPEVGLVVLTAGLRSNYWTFNDEFLLSPRASVAFFPTVLPKWGFRLASGVYYQTPFYKELRDTVIAANGNATVTLNKDIKAQRSFQLVAATDYYFHMGNRPFKFTFEAFGKYIDRLIPYSVDNVKIVYTGQNNGDGYVVGGDVTLFGEFVPGSDSWISFSTLRARENIYGDGVGYITRPTDQRYTISMFFQDHLPNFDPLKVNLKFIWADGLPFGPPRSQRKDAVFRSKAYRRVDIGAVYVLRRQDSKWLQKSWFRCFTNISFGVDVLNLFDISNVNSYYWVTDVSNVQYAVPNYLTGRQLNFHLSVDF